MVIWLSLMEVVPLGMEAPPVAPGLVFVVAEGLIVAEGLTELLRPAHQLSVHPGVVPVLDQSVLSEGPEEGGEIGQAPLPRLQHQPAKGLGVLQAKRPPLRGAPEGLLEEGLGGFLHYLEDGGGQ